MFDRVARKLGFDSLVAENWYNSDVSAILHAEKVNIIFAEIVLFAINNIKGK